jgi:hypothetical protein
MKKQNITLPCSFCRKDVSVKKWQLYGKHKRDKHFCDKNCYSRWQSQQVGFFKGKTHSEKTKELLSMKNPWKNNLRKHPLLGRKLSDEHKLKLSKSKKKYFKDNPDAIRKIADRLTGKKQSADTIKKRISKTKGVKRTDEQKKKMRLSAKKGELNHSWRGGKCKLSYRLKRSSRYSDWRSAVYERDNYTCQVCGIKGGKLNPHHLKPFSVLIDELTIGIKNKEAEYYKLLECEKLWDINNGQTLCVPCHKKTDSYGRSCKTQSIWKQNLRRSYRTVNAI